MAVSKWRFFKCQSLSSQQWHDIIVSLVGNITHLIQVSWLLTFFLIVVFGVGTFIIVCLLVKAIKGDKNLVTSCYFRIRVSDECNHSPSPSSFVWEYRDRMQLLGNYSQEAASDAVHQKLLDVFFASDDLGAVQHPLIYLWYFLKCLFRLKLSKKPLSR